MTTSYSVLLMESRKWAERCGESLPFPSCLTKQVDRVFCNHYKTTTEFEARKYFCYHLHTLNIVYNSLLSQWPLQTHFKKWRTLYWALNNSTERKAMVNQRKMTPTTKQRQLHFVNFLLFWGEPYYRSIRNFADLCSPLWLIQKFFRCQIQMRGS